MPSQRRLDEVRAVMRTMHYSIHTERSYCDWVRRFVLFHKFQSRDELLAAGSVELEAFQTSLALEGDVAAATQNQALNALVFLKRFTSAIWHKSMGRLAGRKPVDRW